MRLRQLVANVGNDTTVSGNEASRLEGESVELRVSVDADSLPSETNLRFVWTKNDNEVRIGSRCGVHQSGRTSRLRIASLSTVDAGRYSCHVYAAALPQATTEGDGSSVSCEKAVFNLSVDENEIEDLQDFTGRIQRLRSLTSPEEVITVRRKLQQPATRSTKMSVDGSKSPAAVNSTNGGSSETTDDSVIDWNSTTSGAFRFWSVNKRKERPPEKINRTNWRPMEPHAEKESPSSHDTSLSSARFRSATSPPTIDHEPPGLANGRSSPPSSTNELCDSQKTTVDSMNPATDAALKEEGIAAEAVLSRDSVSSSTTSDLVVNGDGANAELPDPAAPCTERSDDVPARVELPDDVTLCTELSSDAPVCAEPCDNVTDNSEPSHDLTICTQPPESVPACSEPSNDVTGDPERSDDVATDVKQSDAVISCAEQLNDDPIKSGSLEAFDQSGLSTSAAEAEPMTRGDERQPATSVEVAEDSQPTTREQTITEGSEAALDSGSAPKSCHEPSIDAEAAAEISLPAMTSPSLTEVAESSSVNVSRDSEIAAENRKSSNSTCTSKLQSESANDDEMAKLVQKAGVQFRHEQQPSEEIMFPDRNVEIRVGVDPWIEYEKLERIGSGGFSEVFRCQERATGLILAAKVARYRASNKSSLLYEIDILRQLRHQRVMRLYDVFEHSRRMVLISEYIGGGELCERIIEDNFLSEEQASNFIVQILRGVKYIHSQSIVHLDLKPENIVCTNKSSYDIKIIDFGFAQRYEGDHKPIRFLGGTANFTAPEVINYEPLTFAADIWAVGIMTYLLLSGYAPFDADSDQEVLVNVTKGNYDYEDESFDEISPAARDFIDRILVKNPSTRPTAHQLLVDDWLRARGRRSTLHLPGAVNHMKCYLTRARDKWKAATTAIMAMQKFRRTQA